MKPWHCKCIRLINFKRNRRFIRQLGRRFLVERERGLERMILPKILKEFGL